MFDDERAQKSITLEDRTVELFLMVKFFLKAAESATPIVCMNETQKATKSHIIAVIRLNCAARRAILKYHIFSLHL